MKNSIDTLLCWLCMSARLSVYLLVHLHDILYNLTGLRFLFSLFYILSSVCDL